MLKECFWTDCFSEPFDVTHQTMINTTPLMLCVPLTPPLYCDLLLDGGQRMCPSPQPFRPHKQPRPQRVVSVPSTATLTGSRQGRGMRTTEQEPNVLRTSAHVVYLFDIFSASLGFCLSYHSILICEVSPVVNIRLVLFQ